MTQDHRLLLKRLETIVGMDDGGRLTGRSPHLYVLRTPEHVLCRCHVDLGTDVAAAFQEIARKERGRPREWAQEYAAYLQIFSRIGSLKAVRAGLLYYFAEPFPALGETTVSVNKSNAGLLVGGLDEWIPDVGAGLPMAVVMADSRAVSICASVNASEVAHAAGVETLPEYRGKGLAAQVVSAWARIVQSKGATPFYGTTFDNIASQRVAARLKLSLLGAEFSVECDLC